MGNGFQVVGIDAPPIAAEVVEFAVMRYWTNEHFIGGPVRRDDRPLDSELTATLGATRSRPQPTPATTNDAVLYPVPQIAIPTFCGRRTDSATTEETGSVHGAQLLSHHTLATPVHAAYLVVASEAPGTDLARWPWVAGLFPARVVHGAPASGLSGLLAILD